MYLLVDVPPDRSLLVLPVLLELLLELHYPRQLVDPLLTGLLLQLQLQDSLADLRQGRVQGRLVDHNLWGECRLVQRVVVVAWLVEKGALQRVSRGLV